MSGSGQRDELSDAELDSRLHLMAHNLEQQRADLAAEQRARWGAPPRGDDTPLGLAHCAGAAAAAAGGGGATDFERLIRRLVREEMATLRTADGGGIGEGGGGAAGDTTEQGLAAVSGAARMGRGASAFSFSSDLRREAILNYVGFVGRYRSRPIRTGNENDVIYDRPTLGES